MSKVTHKWKHLEVLSECGVHNVTWAWKRTDRWASVTCAKCLKKRPRKKRQK